MLMMPRTQLVGLQAAIGRAFGVIREPRLAPRITARILGPAGHARVERFCTRQTTSTLWFLLDLTIPGLSGNFRGEVVFTLSSFRFPEYKSAHLKLSPAYAAQPLGG